MAPGGLVALRRALRPPPTPAAVRWAGGGPPATLDPQIVDWSISGRWETAGVELGAGEKSANNARPKKKKK